MNIEMAIPQNKIYTEYNFVSLYIYLSYNKYDHSKLSVYFVKLLSKDLTLE